MYLHAVIIYIYFIEVVLNEVLVSIITFIKG